MRTILIEVSAVLAALLVIFLAGHRMGARGVQMDWDADKLVRSTATNKAMIQRIQDNTTVAAQQATTNATITKAKNEEIAPVVQRIYVDRVRVGPALCGGSAAPAQAASTGSGDGADTAGRLLSPEMDRDIKSLILETEEAAATGRACQSWVRENGLAP